MAGKKDFVGNKQLRLDINTQLDEIQPVAHALSSKLRLEIIKLLGRRSMNVNELSAALKVPLSTISLNVSVLEKAGFILTEAQPGVRGTMKLCSRVTDMLYLNLVTAMERPQYLEQVEMPIGCYSTASGIRATCGLAGVDGELGVMDEPTAFYHPDRIRAQLIWFRTGCLEYRFPVIPRHNVLLEALELSFEACSEAMNYRNEWESDIFLEINGHEIGTWLSPGDFGGRRGVNNPSWWSDISTQFGHLKTWRVDETGSYLDQKRVSDCRVSDLGAQDGDCVVVRMGVKPDAEHLGGMNLFGAGFGDFPQHIILRYAYR